MEGMEATRRGKTLAAAISIGTNVALTSLKLAAAVITGSVSLLSESVHSLVDMLASIVVMFSVRAAAAPPDEEHPYGHAKIESITGLGEGLLLAVLGCGIVYDAARHLASKANLREPMVGIVVLFIAGLASRAAGTWVTHAGKRYSSPALVANGTHLLSDFWTSVSVLASLILVKVTGLDWIDPVVAFGLAAFLIVAGFKSASGAFQQLIDRRLPDEDLVTIRSLVSNAEGVISMHRLRTRLSGEVRYIDFHVVVPATWSVVQAHDLVDWIEDRLEEKLAPTVIVIHVDPFDPAKAGRPLSL
jgi:cation diffusion facilitator family transporter